MEKWLVVAGIWTMCAMCAVFFIRGATSSATREAAGERRPAAKGEAGERRPVDDARGIVRE
jgi:hypothetical protein